MVTPKTSDGWVGLAERGTQVLLDARITPALAQEGMAREVIRHVQSTRKEAGLEMEDRIELYLATDDANLRQAIDESRFGSVMVSGVAQGSRTPLCAAFPSGIVPFETVFYTTGQNVSGDRLVVGRLAAALDGEPYIHDPATVTFCDGKWYTFGTGQGGLISEDGWTWHSGAVRPGGVLHAGRERVQWRARSRLERLLLGSGRR